MNIDEYLADTLTIEQLDKIRLQSITLLNQYGMSLIHMDGERIVWRNPYGMVKTMSIEEWPQLEKELCHHANKFQGSQ